MAAAGTEELQAVGHWPLAFEDRVAAKCKVLNLRSGEVKKNDRYLTTWIRQNQRNDRQFDPSHAYQKKQYMILPDHVKQNFLSTHNLSPAATFPELFLSDTV
ncbi:MAG: hypothetical protein DI539_16505 [Flavobacterium psychrophilum]|jgi:hypothetical protein|nr:MAG: hypothetical protein DI539_16505 [Flavobacterium psychrophilum]